MTPLQFIASVQAIIDASGTTVTTSGRGHGSVKLVTGDRHAAHAYELHALRAGLRFLATTTDEGQYVCRVTGFRFVPSGPAHTCHLPGSSSPCPACGGAR